MKKTIIFVSIITILLCMLVLFGYSGLVDDFIYNGIHSFYSKPMTFVNILITSMIVPMGIILCILYLVNKKKGLLLGFLLVYSYAIGTILKYVFQRPRPSGVSLVIEDGFSMPSSHALISIAFFGLLIYYLRNKHSVGTKVVKGVMVLYILLIGISRIYLGVHYATDILIGYGFGFLILCSYLYIVDMIKEKGFGDVL